MGKTFEIKARSKDQHFVPIWYQNFKTDTKYTQEVYYHTGSGQVDDNIIYLVIILLYKEDINKVSFKSIFAIGLPTMLDLPITTAFFPQKSTFSLFK